MFVRNAVLLAFVAVSLCCSANSISLADTFAVKKLEGRDNLNQTPVGSSGKWSLEKLMALTQNEGIELWGKLPAVPMEELDGHYLGIVPFANDPEQQRKFSSVMHNEYSADGYWLGKAFKPLGESKGEGYNRFRRPGGRIEHRYRMDTYIGKSLVDGKPAFILDYARFDKSDSLIDELRKLDDFIYLGVATVDAGGGKRSEPMFWLLVGPTDRWIGPDEGSTTTDKRESDASN